MVVSCSRASNGFCDRENSSNKTFPDSRREHVLGIRQQAIGPYLQIKLEVIVLKVRAIERKRPATGPGIPGTVDGGEKHVLHHSEVALDVAGLSASLYWRPRHNQRRAGQDDQT